VGGIRYWSSDESDKTPELIGLKLDAMGWMGDTLAEHDGEKLFVFGGIPGEEVTVEVLSRRRNRVAAKVTEVAERSPERIDPACPYFGMCTGCQWLHIRYEYQLELKYRKVREALETIGEMPDAPISDAIPSPDILGYRNHARFTIRRDGSLGFVNKDTRRFLRIDECLLMHSGINQILSQLQGRCGETTQLSIRYGVNTGEWLIQPTMKSEDIPLESGRQHYVEALNGKRFRVAASAFFQVNTMQAEKMAELIRARLDLKGDELVVDAYAGVGTFAVLLAPFAGRVIAIEESASANEDARINVAGLPNVELLEAKTETVLGSLPQAPDILILDPPRVGCRPEALEALKSRPPKRIVYVSCDPRALARDLKILCEGPFVLEEILPVDLFPQTHHIECLATLSLG
jgi:23S rRNA (uracil1939-C5)-methyltransferase